MNIKPIVVRYGALILVACGVAGCAELGTVMDVTNTVTSATGGGSGNYLQQLTPGSADFAKAYALYYEGLGDSTNAAKLAKQAEMLSGGDQFGKESKVLLDGARTEIEELVRKKQNFDDSARAKFSEGNKVYGEGVAKWTVVSGLISAAAVQNPQIMLNPEVTLASAACVKGMADMSRFLGVMRDVSKAQAEANK